MKKLAMLVGAIFILVEQAIYFPPPELISNGRVWLMMNVVFLCFFSLAFGFGLGKGNLADPRYLSSRKKGIERRVISCEHLGECNTYCLVASEGPKNSPSVKAFKVLHGLVRPGDLFTFDCNGVPVRSPEG